MQHNSVYIIWNPQAKRRCCAECFGQSKVDNAWFCCVCSGSGHHDTLFQLTCSIPRPCWQRSVSIVFFVTAIRVFLIQNCTEFYSCLTRSIVFIYLFFRTMTRFWRTIEPFVTSLCLFLAGAAAPSLVSGVYFFTFMIMSTLWAVGTFFKHIINWVL